MTEVDAATKVPAALRQERYALSAVFFTLGGVFASWAGRIPELQEHLSLSDGQLGASMFCLAVGTLVSMPASAALGARLGTDRTTLWFSIWFCLALLLLPLAPNWLLFSAALFSFGFGMGGQDVSMNAHAVQVERAYNKPIMSAFHGLFSVGAMAGGGISSLMCAVHAPPLVHFVIVAGILVPILLMVGRTLTPAVDAEKQGRTPVFVLPDRHVLVLAAVAFCSFVGEGAIFDWSAVYLAHELHSGPSIAAAGFTIFSLSMAFCRFLGDSIVHKLGPARVLLFGGLIAGGGIAASLLVESPAAVLLAYVFVGIGFSCMVPVAFSTAGRNPHLSPSVAIAGVATAGYAGFVIAPPIIGFVADHYTLRTALWIAAALSLTVSALSPLAVRETDRPADLSP